MSKPHRRRRRPSAAFIISCLALFMAMGGVSYGFAAGSIDSKEIKNNDVRGKDVREATLNGSDVKGNSLKGGDIDESSLGKVPLAASADNAATVGGVGADALTIGRGSTPNDCEPGGAPIKCATLTLDVPRPGRALVMVGGQWNSDEVAGTSVRGVCSILHNNLELSPATSEGTTSDQTDNNQEQAIAAQPVVTDVLQPGSHEFALACDDEVGDMDFTNTRIAAVLLGSS
jgi:hypothetical protein